MPGYVIARVEVTDADKYREYAKATPPTIFKYEGKILARGGETITLEGSPNTERVVILEFPTPEKAKAWYHSQEYQTVKKLREGAAKVLLFIIDGV